MSKTSIEKLRGNHSLREWAALIESSCIDCHNEDTKTRLNITALNHDLSDVGHFSQVGRNLLIACETGRCHRRKGRVRIQRWKVQR